MGAVPVLELEIMQCRNFATARSSLLLINAQGILPS
jgi:hypothetical protein